MLDTPNILIISMDQHRWDALGCANNPVVQTPNIDRLAREATLFERAYSQAAWTLPSVASYMTGQYPPPRGEIGRAFLERPIASLLLDAGLETAGFSENPYVTRQFGIDSGFQVFREYFPYSSLAETPSPGSTNTNYGASFSIYTCCRRTHPTTRRRRFPASSI